MTGAGSDPGNMEFRVHRVAHLTRQGLHTSPRQGQLWVQVTTSSNSWGLGFRSGSMVVLVDQDGNKVDVSPLCTAGVDAKSVFWGRSTRVDTHIINFSPEAAGRTTQLVALIRPLGRGLAEDQ